MGKDIKSLELIQSYVLSTARYSFTTYEKRILFSIVKDLQHCLKDLTLSKRHYLDINLFGEVALRMTFSTKEVLAAFEKDNTVEEKNHAQVKKALWSLRRKDFEYEDTKGKEYLVGIIGDPVYDKRSETFSFSINPIMLNAFVNFSKGYRKYVFSVAMRLKSIYAMRFYELFSNKLEPITYSIEALKDMFQVSDKYRLVADFKRFVLDRAKKELDKKSPFSFNYKMIKTGRKFTHVLFTPYKIAKNQPPEVEQKELDKQISPFWSVSPELTSILIQHFGYDKEIIKNHKKILELVTRHLNFTELLREIYGQIHNNNAINNVPAYMYGIFRNKLAEKGIYLDSDNTSQKSDQPAPEEWEEIKKQLEKL